jgi:hypothetical protein
MGINKKKKGYHKSIRTKAEREIKSKKIKDKIK